MYLISSDFLEWFGILTALFGVLAIVKWWRSEFIPVHWIAFVAMIIGSLGISMFMYEVGRGDFSTSQLIMLSRWLWFFVLAITFLMFTGVLVYKGD